MNAVEVTVVIDNISFRDDAPAEHGLCLHLRSGGQAMLFDAGRSSQVLANLEALKLVVPGPSWIALSHGHYDHTTGVPEVVKRYPEVKLHFHPRLLEPKWMLDPGEQWRYGGVPTAFYDLGPRYLQPHRCCMELIPGVQASGSVAGDNAQSTVRGRFFRNPSGHTVVDAFPDEQVLLVKTEKGLSIVSGCMHAGLEATIAKARELYPADPFYGLVGGFHLDGKSEDDFALFLAQVQTAGFQKVMPLHCTGRGFVKFLAEQAPLIFQDGFVSAKIEL